MDNVVFATVAFPTGIHNSNLLYVYVRDHNIIGAPIIYLLTPRAWNLFHNRYINNNGTIGLRGIREKEFDVLLL